MWCWCSSYVQTYFDIILNSTDCYGDEQIARFPQLVKYEILNLRVVDFTISVDFILVSLNWFSSMNSSISKMNLAMEESIAKWMSNLKYEITPGLWVQARPRPMGVSWLIPLISKCPLRIKKGFLIWILSGHLSTGQISAVKHFVLKFMLTQTICPKHSKRPRKPDKCGSPNSTIHAAIVQNSCQRNMTTSLTWAQNSQDPVLLEHPWDVPEFCRSFVCCGIQGGTSIGHSFSGTSHGSSVRFEPWEFCGHVDILSSFSSSSRFCGVAACIVLLRNPLSLGCTDALGGMFDRYECLGQIVCIKWHPHECQDQGFCSKTLNCIKLSQFPSALLVVLLVWWELYL